MKLGENPLDHKEYVIQWGVTEASQKIGGGRCKITEEMVVISYEKGWRHGPSIEWWESLAW
jgi:hypothetical protein